MTKKTTMPVLFRASRGKNPELTAVFPTEVASPTFGEMTCYARVGQHGACNATWYHGTRKARPDEYADLLTELRGIYGTSIGPGDPIIELVVYDRIQPWMRKAYRAEFDKLYKSN